jgi:hypothetical protein
LRPLAAMLATLLIATAASAQHGTAKSGYFPARYNGDTWTGVVTNVNDTTGEFTLTYTKGDKTQTFVGIPEEGYTVSPKNGPERLLKPSDIHIGRTLTVFYMPDTKKVDGKKVTVNIVIIIDSIPNVKIGATVFRSFG